MREMRPQSNRIDRFGRIAHDKNENLSQASLDLSQQSNNDFSLMDRRLQEEVKAHNNNRRDDSNPRIFQTDQKDLLKFNEKRRKIRAKMSNKEVRDPMELEFCVDSVVARLNKKQKEMNDPSKNAKNVISVQKEMSKTDFDKAKEHHK